MPVDDFGCNLGNRMMRFSYGEISIAAAKILMVSFISIGFKE
jgi:hypothetical protein